MSKQDNAVLKLPRTSRCLHGCVFGGCEGYLSLFFFASRTIRKYFLFKWRQQTQILAFLIFDGVVWRTWIGHATIYTLLFLVNYILWPDHLRFWCAQVFPFEVPQQTIIHLFFILGFRLSDTSRLSQHQTLLSWQWGFWLFAFTHLWQQQAAEQLLVWFWIRNAWSAGLFLPVLCSTRSRHFVPPKRKSSAPPW